MTDHLAGSEVLLIDKLAARFLARPARLPRIEPAEAIALALGVLWCRQVDPAGPTVTLILRAIAQAGWQFVPKERAP